MAPLRSLRAFLAGLLLAVAACAPQAEPATGAIANAVKQAMAAGTEHFDHAAWSRLLDEAIRDGLVDYRKMQAERPALDAYLERVAAAPLARLSRPELLALLINAYNALTIRSILDHPSVGSIRDIPGVWNKVTHRVGGFDITLDALEHTILRPYFKDPRIHYAINCASRSCAPLPSFAFDGERLESQLDLRMARFLTDPANVRADGGVLSLSSYFDWFKADFTGAGWKGAAPTVVLYVRAHATPLVRAFIDAQGGTPQVKILGYDWSLNAAVKPDPAIPGHPVSSTGGGWLASGASWVRDRTAGYGTMGAVVFGVVYVIAVLLMVPAGPLTIAAGAAYGLAGGFVLVSIASTVAAVLAFLIARYLLRERIRTWLARWPSFDRVDRAVEQEGWKVVAMTRLSPVVPYNVLNYAFGVSGVRLLPYALASWAGMIPGTLLYVGAGAVSLDLATSHEALGAAGIGLRVVGVLATAGAVWWLARAARGKLALVWFLLLAGLAGTAHADRVAAPRPPPSPNDPLALLENLQVPGNFERFEALVKAGLDPNAKTDRGDTLFLRAVRTSCEPSSSHPSDVRRLRHDAVNLLLERGADPKIAGPEGNALHVAANQGDVTLTALFIAKGLPIDDPGPEGKPPLFCCLPFGPEPFGILLHKGADPALTNGQGRTLRQMAEYFHGSGKVFLDMLELHARGALPPAFPPQILPPREDPPLITAVRKGDDTEVVRLLTAGASPDAVSRPYAHGHDDYQEAGTFAVPALVLALAKGHTGVARLLIERGANVNLRGAANDYTDLVVPLHLAVKYPELLELLLKRGAEVDRPTPVHRTTALFAASDAATLDRLLKAGAKIDHRGTYATALVNAVHLKKLARVNELLERGANPNLSGSMPSSTPPLHAAVEAGDPAIVAALLARGADRTAKNESGLTAGGLALSQGKADLAKLIDGGASKPEDRVRLFRDAISHGKVALLAQLLGEGMRPADDAEYPALIQMGHAFGENRGAILDLLLKHGASPAAVDSNRRTALHLLLEPELAAKLIKAGADPNAADDQGRTPLHEAARQGLVAVVKVLLESGARADAVSTYGDTPLHAVAHGPIDHRPADGPAPRWAEQMPQYLEIVQRLLDAKAPAADRNKSGHTPADVAAARTEPEMAPLKQRLQEALSNGR